MAATATTYGAIEKAAEQPAPGIDPDKKMNPQLVSKISDKITEEQGRLL